MINNFRRAALAAVAATVASCGAESVNGPEDYQGVVELEESHLGFELGGRVADLPVHEGDVVESGALLGRLDDALQRKSRDVKASEARVSRVQASQVKAGARSEEVRSLAARVAAARAVEENLAKQLERERALLQRNVVAQAAVDDLTAQSDRSRAERQALEHELRLLQQGARKEDVAVAEARAEAADVSVSLDDERIVRHDLRAPFRGTVLDVHFEVGEVVAAGTPIVTMADLRRPYVDVFVPQQDIARVSLGQPARIRIDSLREPVAGRVENIARNTEFTPRFLFSERERPNLVVRVRVRVDDAEERLRAGVPAFVSFQPREPNGSREVAR